MTGTADPTQDQTASSARGVPPWPVKPKPAICSFCPWEQMYPTEDKAETAKRRHEHLRHNQPLPTQEITGADWQAQAVEAVRQVAARGQDFRIFDALKEFGLQSPPDQQHRIGRFATLVHDMGIAHKVGSAPSTRDRTNKSDAGVWNRNPARCTSPRCKARAA